MWVGPILKPAELAGPSPQGLPTCPVVLPPLCTSHPALLQSACPQQTAPPGASLSGLEEKADVSSEWNSGLVTDRLSEHEQVILATVRLSPQMRNRLHNCQEDVTKMEGSMGITLPEVPLAGSTLTFR